MLSSSAREPLIRCGNVADNLGWRTRDGRGHFCRNTSMPKSQSWEAYCGKRWLGDFPTLKAARAAFDKAAGSGT